MKIELKINEMHSQAIKKHKSDNFADAKYLYSKILEINPRIQGTSVAALGIGVNLPKLAVETFTQKKVNIPEIKWDVEFIRYYNELFF